MARWGLYGALSYVVVAEATVQVSCPSGRDCSEDERAAEDVTLLQLRTSSRATLEAVTRPSTATSCPTAADWIVVGGGAGGCAAAAALADGGEDVLLLERGPNDLDVPTTQDAADWPKVVNEAGELFRFKEGTWGVVANVLGGGTSLNGGLFYGIPETWFSANMPKVNYTAVHASAVKLANELAKPLRATPYGLAWNTAMEQSGWGTADLKDASLQVELDKPFVPLSTFHFDENKGPRLGAAHLVHSRKSLSNLRVVTEATILKIVFEGTQAVGVRLKLTKSGIVCDQVTAAKGVIMAAGAIMTPQLLQISGVGPEDVLKGLNVTPVVTVAGVGSNFVDRLVATVAAMSPVEVPFTIGFTVRADAPSEQLIEGVGGGLIGSELAVSSLALLPPLYRDPLLRSVLKTSFNLLPNSMLGLMNQMAQAVSLQMDTKSRGWVKAISTDPTVLPEVSANYFADPYDLQSQVHRLQALVRLFQTDAMSNYTMGKASDRLVKVVLRFVEFVTRHILSEQDRLITGHSELFGNSVPLILDALSCIVKEADQTNRTIITIPCMPDISDAQAMEKYARDNVISSYHYFGTMAHAIDPKTFAVSGTSNLYVADASVIPAPPIANPQGVIMALGHYLGGMLLR